MGTAGGSGAESVQAVAVDVCTSGSTWAQSPPGRTIVDTEDHRRFVKKGGCTALIDALVTPVDFECPKVA